MGPSALAGFGIFFLLVPVQQRIMAHQIRVRKKSTKFTEQRAGVLMEVLSSMKIVKYFCYEIPFLNRAYERHTHHTAIYNPLCLQESMRSESRS